jgi:hypothetical protein
MRAVYKRSPYANLRLDGKVVSKLRSAEVEEKIEYSEYTIPLK